MSVRRSLGVLGINYLYDGDRGFDRLAWRAKRGIDGIAGELLNGCASRLLHASYDDPAKLADWRAAGASPFVQAT